MAKPNECKPVAVERWVRRSDLSFGDVDFVDGTTVTPSINGGNTTWPGADVVQNYIDTNIDYDTPTGTQTGLTVGQPTTAADQTDSRAIIFQTEVAPGNAPTLSWTFTGEGFIRVEVDEGCCGCWETLTEFYGEASGPQNPTAVLPEGVHRVRVTNVDIGGASSIWTYTGDTVLVAPASEPKLVQRAVLVQDCCGNITSDGAAFNGEILGPDEVTEPACPEMCKRIGDTLVGSEIGDTIVANPGPELPDPPVGSLYHPQGVDLILDAGNAVGDTASTEELVIKGYDGCDIPVRVTTERATVGGSPITFRNNRVFFTPGASDQIITIELLPDCFGTITPVEWSVWAASISGGEAVVFDAANPVTSFAQGPAGQDISAALPYVGAWNNNNNNNFSGFGFDASTTFTFRKNGQGNVGASMVFGAIQVPECVDYKLCDLPCAFDERFTGIETQVETLTTTVAGFEDTDQQTLTVDCDTRQLVISNGNAVPTIELGNRIIYRYAPSATPGFRTRWWLPAAGPHLDPAQWAGPPDPGIGFPLPAATAPDFEVVADATANINDNNTIGQAARYSIIEGWVFVPQDSLIRDANPQTGELGFVLIGDCCTPLTQGPGGNTTDTDGVDTSLLDPTPITAGWHYIYNPTSDSAVFNGLLLELSTDDGATWTIIETAQPDQPVVEAIEVPACEPIPDGWQVEPLNDVCCPPSYSAASVASTPPTLNVTTAPVYEYRDIWAEEGGATDPGSAEWSFGNGAVGFLGLPIDDGWEVEAMYFHAETYPATATIQVDLMDYGNVASNAAANTITSIALTSSTDGGGTTNNAYKYETIDPPVPVPVGVIGFITRDETGAISDARVGARLRRKVGDYVTEVTL